MIRKLFDFFRRKKVVPTQETFEEKVKRLNGHQPTQRHKGFVSPPAPRFPRASKSDRTTQPSNDLALQMAIHMSVSSSNDTTSRSECTSTHHTPSYSHDSSSYDSGSSGSGGSCD